jgi:hypothetical protein
VPLPPAPFRRLARRVWINSDRLLSLVPVVDEELVPAEVPVVFDVAELSDVAEAPVADESNEFMDIASPPGGGGGIMPSEADCCWSWLVSMPLFCSVVVTAFWMSWPKSVVSPDDWAFCRAETMADSICWFKLAEDVVVPEELVLSDVAEVSDVAEAAVVEESVDVPSPPGGGGGIMPPMADCCWN